MNHKPLSPSFLQDLDEAELMIAMLDVDNSLNPNLLAHTHRILNGCFCWIVTCETLGLPDHAVDAKTIATTLKELLTAHVTFQLALSSGRLVTPQ